jgi:hypothetical protein
MVTIILVTAQLLYMWCQSMGMPEIRFATSYGPKLVQGVPDPIPGKSQETTLLYICISHKNPAWKY